MGLIDRLLRGRAKTGSERQAGPTERPTISREELGALRGDEGVQPSPKATGAEAAANPSTVADAALREALNAVQGVVDKARSYVTEIGGLQEKKAEQPERPQPEAQVPAAQGTGALMTEASAAVLIEYLKHFFDLVSMQNRLLERRLDSLEAVLSRLDQHVTEDAAEVSARLSTLEGVQLPLVKAEAGAGSMAATQPEGGKAETRSRQDEAVSTIEPSEEHAIEEVPRTYEELVAPAFEEPATAPEVTQWEEPPPEASSQEPSFEAEPPEHEELEAEEPTGVEEAASPTASLGEPASVGLPSDVEEPAPGVTGGQPMQGVLRLEGLESFRSLFAIRDELRRRGDVLNADAASFEAGHGELRVKATRVIGDEELVATLAEATGQTFAATGPMSFAAAPRSTTAGG